MHPRTAAAEESYHITGRTSLFLWSDSNPTLTKAVNQLIKSLVFWKGLLKIGSNWENRVQLPQYVIYDMQKGEKAFGHR